MRIVTIVSGFLVASTGALCSCGGGDSNVSDTGGAGGTNPGRTVIPNVGGSSKGGTGNSGGSPSAPTGGTAGAVAGGGNSNCPIWPASKLLPFVGAQFYGPDPGPCSQLNVLPDGLQIDETYVYSEAGRLESVIYTANGETEYTYAYDDQGRVISQTGAYVSTVAYSDGHIRITSPGMTQYYTLDALGYPVTNVEASGSGTAIGTMTSVYENCRMVSMYYTKADGSRDLTRGFTEIIYDDAGHIVTRKNANTGRYTTFDYSCW